MFTLTITGQTAGEIAADAIALATLFGNAPANVVADPLPANAPPNAVVLNADLGKLPEKAKRAPKDKTPTVGEELAKVNAEAAHPALTAEALAEANAKAQAEAKAWREREDAKDAAKAQAAKAQAAKAQAAKAQAAEEPAKAEPDGSAAPTIDYTEVTTALFQAQTRTNRDTVVAILAKHGLTTARGSDPSIWPALVADLNAAK